MSEVDLEIKAEHLNSPEKLVKLLYAAANEHYGQGYHGDDKILTRLAAALIQHLDTHAVKNYVIGSQVDVFLADNMRSPGREGTVIAINERSVLIETSDRINEWRGLQTRKTPDVEGQRRFMR